MLFSEGRTDRRVKQKQESTNWDGNPGQEGKWTPMIANNGNGWK